MTNPNTPKLVVGALGMAVMPTLLISNVWVNSANAATGRYDWVDIAVHLTILSVLVLISTVFFAVLFITGLVANSENTEDEPQPKTPEVMVMPPARKPLIGRNESRTLFSAGAAGLLGGLLAFFALKSRDKQS